MFVLNDDMSIYTTRGDVVFFAVLADTDEGEAYTFKPGDVVRMKIFNKKNCDDVVLQKDFPVFHDTEQVEIILTKEDTKLGKVVSKPTDFWYEIELNPDTDKPRTLVGYTEDGPAVLRIMPEGADLEEYIPTEEDIPFVDTELDLTSPRPVANRAIAARIVNLKRAIEGLDEAVKEPTEKVAALEGEIARLGKKITELEDQIANSGGGAIDIPDIEYTENSGVTELPDVYKMRVVGTCSGYLTGDTTSLLLLDEDRIVVKNYELVTGDDGRIEDIDITIKIPQNAKYFVTSLTTEVGQTYNEEYNQYYSCALTVNFSMGFNGGYEEVLIWENKNPSDSNGFYSETIEWINNTNGFTHSDFDRFKIYAYASSYSRYILPALELKYSETGRVVDTEYYRPFSINARGIYVDYAQNGSEDNPNYIIPYRIYGVKISSSAK